MSKQLEIEHHYGWVKLENETPYEHIRRTHTFLTDDNHTWQDTGQSIVVYFNENSPPGSSIAPSWATRNPGDFWFSMPYSEVSSNPQPINSGEPNE